MTRAALALGAVTACGRIGFDELSVDGSPDAQVDAAAACATGPWGPLRSQTQLQSAKNDWEPALHPDGRVLVFSRQDATDSSLWVATRSTVSGDFDAPAPLVGASSASAREFGPMWSPDGTQLWFRFDDGIEFDARSIVHLGGGSFSSTTASVDVPGASFSWDITPDGLELFYTTVVVSDYDLEHAARSTTTAPWVVDDAVSNLRRVGMSEGWPAFDAGRGILYFERDGASGAVLVEAARPTPGARFELIGPTAIVSDQDGDPDLSVDGQTLVFGSSRNSGGSDHDVFMTTRSCR